MTKKIKVLHISPTYFSPESVTGGGERYVLELAKAMSNYADVKILSFGKKTHTFFDKNVEIQIIKPIFYIKKNILNPLSLIFLKEFIQADIIHVHQVYTVLTEMSLIWARLLGKPVFVTDHGGGGTTYLSRLGIVRLATCLLTVSDYSGERLKELHSKRRTIYGGVDETQFYPVMNINKCEKKIISFGRILPHKGFHHLIQAISDESLTIIGPARDLAYLGELKKLSLNKKITFYHDVSDSQLKKEIWTSVLAVFPSTNQGVNGEILSGEAELLGIAPLEAMAMGIPTIVSNIGAYSEICFDKNSLLYENGNVADLKMKIDNFWKNSNSSDFGAYVAGKFTWDKASIKCLEYYKLYGGVK